MEGQSMSTTLPPFPKEFEGKPLLIFDKGGFAYINPALFHDFLAQDLDLAQANILAVVQKPGNLSGILHEKSESPAWKQLPTWYQVSENDRAIPSTLIRKKTRINVLLIGETGLDKSACLRISWSIVGSSQAIPVNKL
jgi:hypothetical protein